MQDARTRLEAILSERIAVLDGSWGVLIQREVRGEEAYRGERFKDHPLDVAGDPDLLNLTRPEVVLGIHRDYFAAGADIATTNTFTATTIGQADYGLEDHAYEMNVAGAQLARQAADEVGGFVAGSVGPLNVTLSLSPRVDDPAFRTHTFDQIRDAYADQIRALAEGGVDFLLIETIFDTLNAKAAIAAALEHAPDLPLWISFTAIDRSGRNLSGQTVDAFWLSVEHAKPFIVGVNCSLGATQMRPFVEDLARVAPTWVACHPNAGLPNEMGTHDEQPHDTSSALRGFAQDGLVNVVGGCCGTTPEHVKAISAAVRGQTPRRVPDREHLTRLSGLEPFRIFPESNFVMVGERTNVTGSARFRRLIEGGDFQEAVEVALEQVRGGANILDVNMDADLLESVGAMTTFLNLLATEPDVARIPIMVDSSRWSVLEAGLKCLQGKGVVNSISLKEGEEQFLEQARRIKLYGAAVVVMAFDEQGQADTIERKVDICGRAYDLLVGEGWEPEDIIFDPNVLAVATGIEEHSEFAKAFIEAARQIKERCPGAKISGGISNLSFSFRGNDAVREAMHAAFLYHAIAAGLDMGIVNAGQLAVYQDIEPELLEHVEDVIFNRREDATERLVEYASRVAGRRHEAGARPLVARGTRGGAALARARARHRRLHRRGHRRGETAAGAPAGRDRGPADERHGDRGRPLRLGKDVPAPGCEERTRDEARRRVPRAVHGGGEGGGSPRAARPGQGRACDRQGRRARHRQEHRRCRPGLQQLRGDRPRRDGAGRSHPRHGDRGGLRRRRALGPDHALARRDGQRREGDGAPRARPAAADRRRHHVQAAHRRADRSRVRAADASRPRRLTGRPRRLEPPRSRAQSRARRREPRAPGPVARAVRREGAQAAAADRRRAREQGARSLRRAERAAVHGHEGRCSGSGDVADLHRLAVLLPCVGAEGQVPGHPRRAGGEGAVGRRAGAARRDRRGRAVAAARCVRLLAGARRRATTSRSRTVSRFSFLRQQSAYGDSRPNRCLADYVAPAGDHIGAFAVAVHGADELSARYEAEQDDYKAIMVKALADRLAEAFAEYLHQQVRHEWYEPDEQLSAEDLAAEKFRGIRPAFGYPACPDHTEKRKLFELLDAERAGLDLTESFAMTPASAVSGIYLASPSARYFSVGRLARDQVEDYAGRKSMSIEEAERWLAPNLGYENRSPAGSPR